MDGGHLPFCPQTQVCLTCDQFNNVPSMAVIDLHYSSVAYRAHNEEAAELKAFRLQVGIVLGAS